MAKRRAGKPDVDALEARQQEIARTNSTSIEEDGDDDAAADDGESRDGKVNEHLVR